MEPPEIDFRYAPNSGHSEAHAGLPLVTQAVSKRSRLCLCDGLVDLDGLARRFSVFADFVGWCGFKAGIYGS